MGELAENMVLLRSLLFDAARCCTALASWLAADYGTLFHWLFTLPSLSLFTSMPYPVHLLVYKAEEHLAALKHRTELHSLLEPFVYRVERTYLAEYPPLPPNPGKAHAPVQHIISGKV